MMLLGTMEHDPDMEQIRSPSWYDALSVLHVVAKRTDVTIDLCEGGKKGDLEWN